MKVKELIDELKKFPEDMEVYVETQMNSNAGDVGTIDTLTIYKDILYIGSSLPISEVLIKERK